jgi:N-methylhydantoinase A
VLTAARADTLAEDWLSQPWQPEGDATVDHRDVVFDDPNKPLKTQILWRPALAAGTRIVGPAVIEEPNSTTLIHPDDQVLITEAGHMIVTLAY